MYHATRAREDLAKLQNKETSAPLGSEGPHQAGEMYHATRVREDLAKLQV